MAGTAWLPRAALRLRTPGLWLDVAPVAVFAALAFWVTARLWIHPGTGVANNPADQAFFEWVLAHGARVVSHGVDPFHSAQMGAPDGVNLMANTSVLGISIPLSPVTLLFGPGVAFNLAITLGLFLTATSWYFVLAKALLRSRAAGWVGGLFCGFAPGLVSHSNAHVNIVAQALVPILIWRTLRLAQEGRWLRNGLWLALVAAFQFFINAEMLLMVAVGMGLFVLVLATDPAQRARWRPFVAGLGVAAAATALVVAYPLWVLLFGPGAYQQVPAGYRTMGADLAAYIGFSRQSLAGSASEAARLAQNPTEENAFFGWPLMVLTVVLVVMLRRQRAVLGIAAAGLVAGVLSLGPELILRGHTYTGIVLPERAVARLPLFTSIVPTRWALVVTIAIGALLAVAVTELRARSERVRVAGTLALVACLTPLIPKPLPVVALTPPPPFLSTQGAWRQYAAGGHTLMFLPMASNMHYDPIRWSAQTLNEMAFTQGYFLTAGPDGTAIDTAPMRWLTRQVLHMQEFFPSPKVNAEMQRLAYADLRYWNVGAVVLLPGNDPAYLWPMSDLLGFDPTTVGGAQVWDVRGLTAPPPDRSVRP